MFLGAWFGELVKQLVRLQDDKAKSDWLSSLNDFGESGENKERN